MRQTIEIDDEVYDCLKGMAEPFVDTPNSVLRRVLGIDPDGKSDPAPRGNGEVIEPTPSASRSRKRSSARRSSGKKAGGKQVRARATAGSILREEEYEMPLLEALIDAGGSAASREVVEQVGKKLNSRLTDIDREPLKSGAIRWENRLQFVRLKMIQRGWMEKDTPRGTWAISDEGRKHVAEGRASAGSQK